MHDKEYKQNGQKSWLYKHKIHERCIKLNTTAKTFKYIKNYLTLLVTVVKQSLNRNSW